MGRGGSKFCRALSLYSIWGCLYEKEYKIRREVIIYLGSLPGSWKGPVKVRGPEA